MNSDPTYRQRKIDPTGIYSDGELRLILDVGAAVTARARRSGDLRHARQGRRVIYRGQWILDWLDAIAQGNGGVR